MPPATDTIWRAMFPEVGLRHWDDELVVFAGASGDTHLLDLVGGTTLKHLRKTPANLHQIAATVSGDLNIQLDDVLLQSLQNILIEFDHLGLIEPSSF